MVSVEIKTEFVRQVLENYGEKLMKAFKESIVEKDLIDKEILINSLKYEVKTSDKLFDGLLSIIFATHGRYQDVKAYNTPAKIKTENPQKNAAQYKQPKRKNKKPGWYTHNVYGYLNSMIYELSNYLTEETIDLIKNSLENESTTKN